MPPMKGTLLVAGLVVVMDSIALWLHIHAVPPFGITERSYARIETGMTSKEVEAIIGVPFGNYGFHRHAKIFGFRSSNKKNASKSWNTPSTTIFVFFDAAGCVKDKWIYVDPPGFRSRLAMLVGLN